MLFRATLVALCSSVVMGNVAEFQKHPSLTVSPTDPNTFSHDFHTRDHVGRQSLWKYTATKHPHTIHPHVDDGVEVTACDTNTVTLLVQAGQSAVQAEWGVGHLFTYTADEGQAVKCPHPITGVHGIAYRNITNLSRVSNADGTTTLTATTEKVRMSAFFSEARVTMRSSQLEHNRPPAVEAPEGEARREEETTPGPGADRRLLGLWSHIKHVFKKAVKTLVKVVKLLVTGKLDWDTEHTYDTQWNKDSTQTVLFGTMRCKTCNLEFKAGYALDIHIEHYKIHGFNASVSGNMDINMHLEAAKSQLVNIQKSIKPLDAFSLFSVQFMIGPVPIKITGLLDLTLSLGLTVGVVGGDVPSLDASVSGDVWWTKQYTPTTGWTVDHSHNLSPALISGNGGELQGVLTIGSHIVPTISIENMVTVSMTVAPLITLTLDAKLPNGGCTYTFGGNTPSPKPPTYAPTRSPAGPGSCGAGHGYGAVTAPTPAHTGKPGAVCYVHYAQCSLSINIEAKLSILINGDIDIHFDGHDLYKKKLVNVNVLDKHWEIPGFPKCLIGSFGPASPGPTRRRLLEHPDTSNFTGIDEFDAAFAVPVDTFDCGGSPCSGEGGMCLTNDASPYCRCKLGWGGASCSVAIDALTPSGAHASIRDHPQPEMCMPEHHAVTVGVSLPTCQDRVGERVCSMQGDGHADHLADLDATVAFSVAGFKDMGAPCTHAMASLFCSITLPSIDDEGRMVPISHESCVSLSSNCLGFDADAICSQFGTHGAVAPPNSPWPTTEAAPLNTSAHHAPGHSECVMLSPMANLKGCPDRAGRRVWLNKDSFATYEEADTYVAEQLEEGIGEGLSKGCETSMREQLCVIHLPACTEDGMETPQLLSHARCNALNDMCDEEDGQLSCDDHTAYFTKHFVGKTATECGMATDSIGQKVQKPAAEEPAWEKDPAFTVPVSLFSGMALGIAAVLMYQNFPLFAQKRQVATKHTIQKEMEIA